MNPLVRMTLAIRLLCVALLLMAASGTAQAQTQTQAAPTPGCEDFLEVLGGKPDYVEYQGCRPEFRAQGKPLVARYRLDGVHAAQAQEYLRQRFGMGPLRFRCCGWEAPMQYWRDPRTGREYMIAFASEETLYSDRAQWSLIDSFHLRVELYTEEI
ncbi:DUF4952 domain-containing protein [Achromobacter aegrifaciens]